MPLKMNARELPRRFHLLRLDDESGVSGPGVVAEGVQFTNGSTVLTWLTHLTSVAVYHSVDVLERIHGHCGKTVVVWDDNPHEKADESIDRDVESSISPTKPSKSSKGRKPKTQNNDL